MKAMQLAVARRDGSSSNRRHPIDPPRCLVHAEHEILIFLYFVWLRLALAIQTSARKSSRFCSPTSRQALFF